MKNQIILIFSLILILASCKLNNTKKIVVQNISWIENLKTQFKTNVNQEQQIIHYFYNNKDVYLVDACYQCPDAMSYLYDKEKNKLCEFGGIMGKSTCFDFESKAKFINYEYSDIKK